MSKCHHYSSLDFVPSISFHASFSLDWLVFNVSLMLMQSFVFDGCNVSPISYVVRSFCRSVGARGLLSMGGWFSSAIMQSSNLFIEKKQRYQPTYSLGIILWPRLRLIFYCLTYINVLEITTYTLLFLRTPKR